ncbi:YchJ family protein [Mangrovimonas sp. YM274]|uniref:YchJ family protein n=1 Tax=Mangrovimonas sp. YM274 TaxID=3070660 RepID=UPI0027DC07E3|nr:YchJ family metal-binding protein [Mangrovimonas sp. YM274]WMI70019.1 YchJ family metal-binding protein [Mangrovimonas sp. YM274]
MQCPCDPSKLYSECCQKAHDNILSVSTAEALMRSRFSAFVLADIDYLQKSHHSSKRPSKREKKEIQQWAKSVDWIKLEVLNTTKGTALDDTGTVEFKAFFMEDGNIQVIHENSRFCKEQGHWVYLDAVE